MVATLCDAFDRVLPFGHDVGGDVLTRDREDPCAPRAEACGEGLRVGFAARRAHDQHLARAAGQGVELGNDIVGSARAELDANRSAGDREASLPAALLRGAPPLSIDRFYQRTAFSSALSAWARS